MAALLAARIGDGIDAPIRDHPDLLRGIDRPDHRYGNGDEALAAYRLHRLRADPAMPSGPELERTTAIGPGCRQSLLDLSCAGV